MVLGISPNWPPAETCCFFFVTMFTDRYCGSYNKLGVCFEGEGFCPYYHDFGMYTWSRLAPFCKFFFQNNQTGMQSSLMSRCKFGQRCHNSHDVELYQREQTRIALLKANREAYLTNLKACQKITASIFSKYQLKLTLDVENDHKKARFTTEVKMVNIPWDLKMVDLDTFGHLNGRLRLSPSWPLLRSLRRYRSKDSEGCCSHCSHGETIKTIRSAKVKSLATFKTIPRDELVPLFEEHLIQCRPYLNEMSRLEKIVM